MRPMGPAGRTGTGERIVAKGRYQHGQAGGFVSVRAYLFIGAERGRRLLLRLSNDADFTVNAVEIEVVFLDAEGRRIGGARETFRGLRAAPGQTFATDRGFAVPEVCADFRASCAEAVSGDYAYRLQNGVLTARYRAEEEWRYGREDRGTADEARDGALRVCPAGARPFRAARLIACLAAGILLLMTFWPFALRGCAALRRLAAERARRPRRAAVAQSERAVLLGGARLAPPPPEGGGASSSGRSPCSTHPSFPG